MELSRREVLAGAAAVAAAGLAGVSAGCGGRAAAAEAAGVGGGPTAVREKTGLRVKRIETFTQGTTLSFVRITADDGSEGWGQISTFDADISATILHRKLAPLVLGADPGDVEAIADRCIEANYKYPWSFVCRALAGIDTALWDLLGKRAGTSVCELLGGTPRPLPVYGSSMSRTIEPAAEGQRLARLRDEKGFRAFKVRVGKVTGHDQDERPGRTEELVPAVRQAVGDGVALLADANSCYSPPRAIQVGRLMEAHGYSHFEEPCPYWELEQTAEVAAALDMPVAGGEQDNDLAQWRRMIRMNAVDIVQPDLCYIGGLTRALRVAAMAREAGKVCVPHSANLSWVTVFTLHMFGAIPNAGRHVEFSIERTPWTENLYEPQLEVRGGMVAIPAGPGWGVRLKESFLSATERQASER